MEDVKRDRKKTYARCCLWWKTRVVKRYGNINKAFRFNSVGTEYSVGVMEQAVRQSAERWLPNAHIFPQRCQKMHLVVRPFPVGDTIINSFFLLSQIYRTRLCVVVPFLDKAVFFQEVYFLQDFSLNGNKNILLNLTFKPHSVQTPPRRPQKPDLKPEPSWLFCPNPRSYLSPLDLTFQERSKVAKSKCAKR